MSTGLHIIATFPLVFPIYSGVLYRLALLSNRLPMLDGDSVPSVRPLSVQVETQLIFAVHEPKLQYILRKVV